jgi:hypothetical protein
MLSSRNNQHCLHTDLEENASQFTPKALAVELNEHYEEIEVLSQQGSRSDR